VYIKDYLFKIRVTLYHEDPCSHKKIELNPAQPSFIKTVVGVGYKFEDEKR
jgi:hypothetical protein